MPGHSPHAVCVYCASSRTADPEYRDVARRLGAHLADARRSIVYGGGRDGSMGALADGALARGGSVVGILPRFMSDLEWGHPDLTELCLVEDLHDRKRMMLERSEAVVALAGGSGTFDEVLEAISLKRLGTCVHPIVFVNTRGFFDPLLAQLDRAIEERFMDPRHRGMWQVVDGPDDVVRAIDDAPPWSRDARDFAAV